ncbi:hypothetical protein NKH18_20655 [Streptomyces sp. M10(2022)]
MLEALGNSPDAAKHFFSDTPTAYNEDGTKGEVGKADLGKEDGEKIETYLDFFGNEKWKSALDFESPDKVEESRGYMPDALGRALEAATLGYPAGHPDAGVERGEENASIMQKVMDKYGDAGLLKKQEAMADSLGIMGAGYIDDINWAVDKPDPESLFTRGADSDGRISFEDQTEGRRSARQFLSALGQHPDAYATLSVAEQVYTRSMIEGQVGPDGTINEGAARSALQVGAQVQGMLDESRAGQAEATSLKAHDDYEKAVAKRAGWIEFGATTGVAAGVAFLPPVAAVGAAAVLIPLATDTGIGVVEQSIGQVIGDISDSSTEDHKEMTDEEIRENKTAIYSAGNLWLKPRWKSSEPGMESLRLQILEWICSRLCGPVMRRAMIARNNRATMRKPATSDTGTGNEVPSMRAASARRSAVAAGLILTMGAGIVACSEERRSRRKGGRPQMRKRSAAVCFPARWRRRSSRLLETQCSLQEARPRAWKRSLRH